MLLAIWRRHIDQVPNEFVFMRNRYRNASSASRILVLVG